MNARHKTGIKIYQQMLRSLVAPNIQTLQMYSAYSDDNFISLAQWLIKIQVQIAIYLFSQELCLHF